MYVIVLLLLSLHHMHIVTSTVYTVTPDDHYYLNSTCHHCHNLRHYLLDITKYFTSNTQLLFQPGLHHLHTDLIIQNVHNISLIGSTANGTTLDTVIQCNSSVAMVMTYITNLTLSDITVKNCKSDRHMNAAILIMECRNVQWTRVTVDSISSNGIIGINVLGDSHFSYIKSHMLSINYSDTQSAQNNSNHAALIDYYKNTNFSSKVQIMNFHISQCFYKVKLVIANAKISWLNNTNIGILITFKSNNINQNVLIIKDSQFVHNTNVSFLLSFIATSPVVISNNTVYFKNCLFSYNKAQFGSIVQLNGLLTNVIINNCKFYSNKELTMVSQRNVMIPQLAAQQGLFTHFSIANTTFSLIDNRYLFNLANAKVQLQGQVIFHNNVCYKSVFYLTQSEISLKGYTEFSANKGKTIIYYYSNQCYLMLVEKVILNVSYNTFERFSFNQLRFSKIPACYFQYVSEKELDTHYGNYSIIFEKNNEKYTQIAYNNLPIVHCSWLPQSAYNIAIPYFVNKQYIHFVTISDDNLNMLPQSSRKKMLCYCNTDNNYDYDCYKETLDSIYPGQTITITLINYRTTFGHEVYQTKDVVVDTSLPTACVVTNSSEMKQYIAHNNCTELKYSIAFPSDNWCELFLRTSSCGIYHTDIYYITQLPCPIGFIKIKGECQCDSSLSEYNIECDINDQTILRPANSWISATTHNNSYTYHISLHCPFHYCLPHSSHLNLSTPNSQCQFNRSGVLCGHCQQGLSIVFSSSYCHHCSNINLLIIVPIVIAGLALVILLFFLNLTISEGIINPFILYANIISIIDNMYFANENKFTPTHMFISLANLDLGIPVCFYNGMDDYAKMWLQLAFPFYLIFIAICLIIASRHFPIVQRLTARRALPVLATLFLLSYTKILLTVSSVLFSYSTITHLPSEHTTIVWSVDGNVPLLGVRFIFLFTVCLVVFLILIPFSLILLCTRKLSKFRFINRFKPLLDTYQGPYKDKFYYWTGLQLVIRAGFFGISALEESLNLAIGTILLCAIGFCQGYCNPYKVEKKNVNDLFLLFNVTGLHILLTYAKDENSSKIVVNVMITIAAIQLLVIITYHIITYVYGGVIRNVIQQVFNIVRMQIASVVKAQTQPNEPMQPQIIVLNNIPDVTNNNYCEYEEPLLDYHD